MADEGYVVKAIIHWADEHPELTVMVFLIIMGCIHIVYGGDPTSIVTGIFGYLTGKGERAMRDMQGGDKLGDF